jgi:hypothetical protein
MKSWRLLLGFIISPLATSVVIAAIAILLVMIATNATLRDATDGIQRLLLFSAIFSYFVALVIGIPLSIQSKRRQWRKLWQNSVAGFSAGLALGVVVTLIVSIFSFVKWMDAYSPFISVLFVGLAGLLNMTALWPFIDHNKSTEQY